MLTQLQIQNIAVIQKASIPLQSGLNVFTGETGAGKTILISAIDAVMGERTSRDIIRTGEEKASVSALFEDISPKVIEKLQDMGYDAEDGTVLIYREMTQAGKNVCRINGMPATVGILKEAAQHLIHIHGQRDTWQLLAPEYHLAMLDEFGNLEAEKTEYKQAYDRMQMLRKERDALDMDENYKNQRLDLLRFQVEDIESAQLEDPNEEEDLLARRKVIMGSERIQQGLGAAHVALTGLDELPGIQDLMIELTDSVVDLSHFMPEYEEMLLRLKEIQYELDDCAGEIQDAMDNFEYDPSELDRVERRLDTIYKMKKKYGESISDILEYYQNILEELETIEFSDEKIKKLDQEYQSQEELCHKLGKLLSTHRKESSERFIQAVESELVFLDMPTVKLTGNFEEISCTNNGIDNFEFYIVTNSGEAPKSLSKIASGGEVSRIMLAIKNVLADKEGVDTLIFDEVDTGVSGRAAGKIGQKLAEVAKGKQVICVTHLAQVAAFAGNHLYIFKDTVENRTFTHVEQLDHIQTITELARITSGDMVTDASLKSAEELWEQAHKRIQ